VKKGTHRTACKNVEVPVLECTLCRLGSKWQVLAMPAEGRVVIPRGGECGTCSGNGVVRERKKVKVDIPSGVEDGMRLRLAGEGDAAATGTATKFKRKIATGGSLCLH
jgi:molecular chaperone DnaJ